jgi:membrane associated rhomboid family serine protease
MGLSDRDYYRDEESGNGFSLTADRSMVVNLVMLNAVLFVVDVFTAGAGADRVQHHWVAEFFSCKLGAVVRPWESWQLFTYGFIHSPYVFSHIFWNMVGLYMFGASVEDRLGRAEFLRFYLGATFFGGLAWALSSLWMVDMPWGEKVGLLFQGQWPIQEPMLLGASAAIMGIIVLFALHNPQRIILAMMLVPMPAWLLATIYVLMDVLGLSRQFANQPDAYGVAYAAHLGGAAFGMAYFHYGWNLGRLQPGWFSLAGLKKVFKRRPSLKIHEPSRTEWDGDEAEVDRILEKISREGSNSLTDRERDILQHASRRYQRKRR